MKKVILFFGLIFFGILLLGAGKNNTCFADSSWHKIESKRQPENIEVYFDENATFCIQKDLLYESVVKTIYLDKTKSFKNAAYSISKLECSSLMMELTDVKYFDDDGNIIKGSDENYGGWSIVKKDSFGHDVIDSVIAFCDSKKVKQKINNSGCSE